MHPQVHFITLRLFHGLGHFMPSGISFYLTYSLYRVYFLVCASRAGFYLIVSFYCPRRTGVTFAQSSAKVTKSALSSRERKPISPAVGWKAWSSLRLPLETSCDRWLRLEAWRQGDKKLRQVALQEENGFVG